MRRSLRLLPAVTAALLLASWLSTVPVLASSVATVKERSKLVVLCSPHPGSTFMKQMSSGNVVGFDYEVMTTFANSLGVELEIRPVEDFDALIPSLLRGEGDVIASSFTITEDRAKSVDFSDSYFPVVVMAVVRGDSPIAGPADLLGRAGSTVAGSSLEEKMKSVGGLKFHYEPQSYLNYRAVLDRKADFAFIDSTSVITQLSKYPDLKVAFSFPEVEGYGYAVTPGSDLREALNQHLAQLRRGGVFFRIVRRLFGEKGLELFQVGQGSG